MLCNSDYIRNCILILMKKTRNFLCVNLTLKRFERRLFLRLCVGVLVGVGSSLASGLSWKIDGWWVELVISLHTIYSRVHINQHTLVYRRWIITAVVLSRIDTSAWNIICILRSICLTFNLGYFNLGYSFEKDFEHAESKIFPIALRRPKLYTILAFLSKTDLRVASSEEGTAKYSIIWWSFTIYMYNDSQYLNQSCVSQLQAVSSPSKTIPKI